MENPEKVIKTYLEKKNKSELTTLCLYLKLPETGTKEEISRKLIPKILTITGQDLLLFPSRIINAIQDLTNLKYSCCEQGYQSGSLTCTECKELQHQDCLDNKILVIPYFCPNCILTKLSPLEPVIEYLVKPIKFHKINSPGELLQIKEAAFYLSETTKEEILENNGKLQIQARCIKMSNLKLEYKWPQKGFLLINNKIAFRLNKTSDENQSKNVSKPVNITMLTNEGKNLVSLVVFNSDKNYFMSVVVVKKITKTELINNVRENHLISKSVSKNFISDIINQKNLDKFKASLNHLSTNQLIRIPARGKYCEHIECFDAESLFESKIDSIQIEWICPICKKLIIDLKIDEYFEEIISDVKNNSKLSFAEFSLNGEYKLFDEELPVKREVESIDYLVKWDS